MIVNAATLAKLETLEACLAALEWARGHGGSLAELWRDCPRGDWLLWYAGKVRVPREDRVRAAAGCAELALPYARAEREVCEAAIAAARAWADAPGVETAKAAKAAAKAARVAAYAAANAARVAYAVTYATYAAANAADAVADAAANAATYAMYAANAAAGAAANAAKGEMRRRCADVVRGYVPFVEV